MRNYHHTKGCKFESIVNEDSIRTSIIKLNAFMEQFSKESAFIDEFRDEIIEYWEANKHRKGYIQIYVDHDYLPFQCGFFFVEKRIKKSSFLCANDSKTNNTAFVHFLWQATHTGYKIGLACEKEMNEESEISN